MWPSSRPAGKGEGEVAVMEDVAHLGRYVYEMTMERGMRTGGGGTGAVTVEELGKGGGKGKGNAAEGMEGAEGEGGEITMEEGEGAMEL